jgi:hypothetical protein
MIPKQDVVSQPSFVQGLVRQPTEVINGDIGAEQMLFNFVLINEFLLLVLVFMVHQTVLQITQPRSNSRL